MRQAIREIDDPVEALFFKAHLEGMEQLIALQTKWAAASEADRPPIFTEITELRTKLMESLEVLRPAQYHG